MMDRASGALSPGLSLAADLHIALSVDGYRAAMEWSAIGGALFELETDASAMPGPRRGQKHEPLAKLNISDVLATEFGALSWRRSLSGVQIARTGLKDTHFMRLDCGQTTPEHGHSALEATVVLEGGLEVNGEVYERGDVALGAPGERHQPRARGDSECICFVAQDKRPFWRLT